MHFFIAAAAALLFTGCSAAPSNAYTKGFISNFRSSVNGSSAHQTGDEYVVIVNSSHPTPPAVSEVLQRVQLTPDHDDVRYIFNNSVFKGFSASMQSHCIDALGNMTDIAVVEQAVSISTRRVTGMPGSSNALRPRAANARTGSPWGLQRISSGSPVSGNAKALDFTYSYENKALGAGVDIYIVDTGINVDHVVFQGRATMGFAFDGNETDGDGHGTHVSGTAAGNIVGVASGANLIGIKVLGADGSGTSTDTIKGIDQVIQMHDARQNESDFVGSIMSMSWALSSTNTGIINVVNAAISAGIHVSVAAGNSGGNACSYSPSSSGGTGGGAISVGSIGATDAISSFSDTGSCVDVYAPGENILSAWNTGTNQVQYLDGTSMATPHVTGVMAYLMAANATLAQSPAAMKAYLAESSLQNTVTGNANVASDSPLLLLNNGVTSTAAKRDEIAGTMLDKRAIADRGFELVSEDSEQRV